jgi:hypothetical protein
MLTYTPLFYSLVALEHTLDPKIWCKIGRDRRITPGHCYDKEHANLRWKMNLNGQLTYIPFFYSLVAFEQTRVRRDPLRIRRDRGRGAKVKE